MYPTLTISLNAPFGGACGIALGSAALGCAWLAKAGRRWRAELWLCAYLLGALAAAALVLAARGTARVAIPTFAAWLLAGIVATWLLLLARFQRLGLPVERVLAVLLGGLAAALAGGRAVHLALSGTAGAGGVASSYGLSVFGAVVGAALFVALLGWAKAIPGIGLLLDAGTSAALLGLGLARLGCLFGGCCHGRPLPWLPPWLGVPVASFDPGTPVRAAFAGQPPDLVIVAVQPIEAAAMVLVALGSELAWRRRAQWRLPPGGVFALGCAGYGAARFTLQFLRADASGASAGLGPSHLLAAGLLVAPAAMVWIAHARRRELPRE